MIGRPARSLLFAFALLAPAETLDRIAVTVGRYVISEQDLMRDIRVSAFLDGKDADLSAAAKRKAAERLVDQYLVLQDALETRAVLATADGVAGLLAPIKARYANDEEYRAALIKARITEPDLQSTLLAGLRMLRYTDVRFQIGRAHV